MDLPEMPGPKRLSFGDFKDWAFLALGTMLVMILVNSIEKLNKHVEELTAELAHKNSEITAITIKQEMQQEEINQARAERAALEARVRALELRPFRGKTF